MPRRMVLISRGRRALQMQCYFLKKLKFYNPSVK